MNLPIDLRQMQPADIPAADHLRSLAGWNQVPDDWGLLLQFGPGGCFAAFSRTQLVGTVTTTIFSEQLAWIGMMLVHPDYQRKGIGTQLMRRALAHLRSSGIACIGLDATPAGFPLYASLGFVAEWTLTRWQRAARAGIIAPAEPQRSQTLMDEDWPSIEALDRFCSGVDRGGLLRALASTALAGRVWRVRDHYNGWGLLRRGAHADYLGPVYGENAEAGVALVQDLLCAATDRAIFWDVPDANESATLVAKQLGFAVLRSLTRMRLGTALRPTTPKPLWAIADPALG